MARMSSLLRRQSLTEPGESAARRAWIVVGPVPPVLHGVAFMTPHVLEGMRRVDVLAAHLDTSDGRPAYTTNTLDPLNVMLALKHVWDLIVLLARHRDAQLYEPISQGRWGFLRDASLIGVTRIARRPVTLHLHGGLFAEFYAKAPAWERWLIRRALGQVEARLGVDGVAPEHVRGADLRRLRPGAGEHLRGRGDRRPVGGGR